jgi:hypothetical protein
VGFEPTIPESERAKTVHAFRSRGHCDRSVIIKVLKFYKERVGLELKPKIRTLDMLISNPSQTSAVMTDVSSVIPQSFQEILG